MSGKRAKMNRQQEMQQMQQQSQQFLQTAMRHAPQYKNKGCTNCGKEHFMEIRTIKILPKMLVGAPMNVVLNFPTTVCCGCGKPFDNTELSEPIKLPLQGVAE